MVDKMLPLRIGVWFQENHTPYGGPGVVLAGTILGFYQAAAATGREVVVLLNVQGDVNWSLGLTPTSQSDIYKMPAMHHGPACFDRTDARITEYNDHEKWLSVRHALFPSTWFAEHVCKGLPFNAAAQRSAHIWPAGVDVDYFCPAVPAAEKTQDYFIYFKSQNFTELKTVQSYFFNNWFGIKGSVLTYYSYDAGMLRDAARASKFCIMLDDTETQGLAALEIMACGCPLFVLDKTDGCGATSVTAFDGRCGVKSSVERLEADFPAFLAALDTYNPRLFVDEDYSYAAAAHRLLNLLETP
jgi:hypothetical protein